MNVGASHARGDILLFLHADTRLPREAFSLIRESLRDLSISGGAFRLAIDSPDPRLRLIARLTTLRSRITRIPFGDQAVFIRKIVFDALGGYREIPVMEDLDLMRRLRVARYPVAILPLAVFTSSRRWEREGIVLGTLRNWVLRGLYYIGVPPFVLAAWYR